MNHVKTPTRQKLRAYPPRMLRTVLEEIRLLRSELRLLLPQDDLTSYVHPNRIKRSYQNALRQYPPSSSWK